MTNARVSVIICCYTLNRLQDVRDTVHSVLVQNLSPREVIVSVDHNAQLLEILAAEMPASVRLVLNDGARGLSETRNVGIQDATGDVVAFLDDDATADRGWLENLVRPFVNPQVAAVTGKVVPLWVSGQRPWWLPEELNWVVGCTYKGMPVRDNEVRNVLGCNMAFRAELFSRVGLFGTGLGRVGAGVYGTGEETQMCLRIRQRAPDSLILYEPEARVLHKVPGSRLTLRYLLARSWDEGLHKARINRVPGYSRSLSAESSYLRYLLFGSIPQRLMRAFRFDGLGEVAAISAGIMATGAGFVWGRVIEK